MNHVDRRRNGFTIIELMLAMAFVSILMMAIAMMIVQMANIYNKGTTLRAVDQAGQAVSQDLQYTLASAQPLDIGTDGSGGLNYKQQVQIGGEITNPDGGRLCTGSYTYVWNTGKGLNNPVNRYETGDQEIRLAKVRDVGGLYCSDVSRRIKLEDATELLSAGDRELAIQSFKIIPVATDPSMQQALYAISLELGTNDQDSLNQATSISTVDTSCKPPSDVASQRDFCAVNKFEFTARAGNRGEN
jgi:prepilin-type N-terminal cleavage/methylation domain-containing protein